MDILSIFQSIVTYIYIPVAVIMILIILLQAGKGGLGTALGGGASQSVFGGGGASEFMAKVTQVLAFGFMLCCVFLAYAGAHSGSSRLKEKSAALEDEPLLAEGQINYERIGPNPLALPKAGAKPMLAPGEEMPSETPVESPSEPTSDDDGEAPTDAVPSDAVPSDAVPSDAVPSDAVPSDAPADPADAPADALEAAPSDAPEGTPTP